MPLPTRLLFFIAITAVLDVGLHADVSQAAIVSDFSSNAEGWKLAGDSTSATPSWLSSGGNPAGYIHGVDIVNGGTWYWDAPAKFLGNDSAAYGQTLGFDLRMRGSGSIFSDSDVILNGAGISLHFDITSAVPQDTTWTHYSVLLSDTAGWKVGLLSGPTATQAQFQSVLANLTQLRIRGEFIDGSDNGDLDNVVLNGVSPAVPEPASLAIWGLAACGCAAGAIRRRMWRLMLIWG